MSNEQQLIQQLLAEVMFLRADKKRMDWLASGGRFPEWYDESWNTAYGSYTTLREALDEQMEDDQ